MEWQLADAKNRFSDLMTRALTIGPQREIRRNEAVIVLSEAEYQRLTGERTEFLEFLLSAPPMDELDLTRLTEAT